MYLIALIIAFITGFYAGKLNINSITIKNFTAKTKEEDNIKDIKEMLAIVKKKKSLPLKLSKSVQNALIEIANTPDWENKIDEDTLNHLRDICNRWKATKNNNTKVVKSSGYGGFHRYKFWEGTYKEYQKQLQLGVIDEYTDVTIIEDEKDYHGSWICIDEDGQMEEYME